MATIRRKLAGIRLALLATTAVAGLLVGGASTASADKGGCPNVRSVKGALQADPISSAHGAVKLAARQCGDQEETP